MSAHSNSSKAIKVLLMYLLCCFFFFLIWLREGHLSYFLFSGVFWLFLLTGTHGCMDVTYTVCVCVCVCLHVCIRVCVLACVYECVHVCVFVCVCVHAHTCIGYFYIFIGYLDFYICTISHLPSLFLIFPYWNLENSKSGRILSKGRCSLAPHMTWSGAGTLLQCTLSLL